MTVSAQRHASSAASEAWGLMGEFLHFQRRRFMAAASEFDLSPPQLGALLQLSPDSPMPMSALADVLACDASNVTGLIDRLEHRGFVERRSAERDRRVKMLALTSDGAELRDRLRARLGQPPEELSRLPASDQRALRDILRKAQALRSRMAHG